MEGLSWKEGGSVRERAPVDFLALGECVCNWCCACHKVGGVGERDYIWSVDGRVGVDISREGRGVAWRVYGECGDEGMLVTGEWLLESSDGENYVKASVKKAHWSVLHGREEE